MYNRMLVPLDGSQLAEVAITYVKNLAARLRGVELYLLHVLSPEERDLAPMHRAYIERAADIIRRHPGKLAAGTKSKEALKVHGELVIGSSPAQEILHYAGENNIDLILMATHGRSGLSRWAMGSVAYRVLRAARVPVWLVRHGIGEEIVQDRLDTRTILVPLDGSKLAEAVLPYVETLAQQWADGQVEVILLRACQPPAISSDYPPTMPVSWEEYVELETAKCKLVAGPYLAEIEKRLKDKGLRVHSEVPLGNPADEIISYALKNRVSLIAMVTHGRSGLSRWTYGSIAEKVMLGAFTPILLVGPQ